MNRAWSALPLRVVTNAFIVLNFTVIGLANLPDDFVQGFSQFQKEAFGEKLAYRFRYANWMLKTYAHYVGLDNKWQMFGRQGRFNWWYVVRAEYSDGETTRTVSLPIPSQSSRSLSQRWLFDLKENKILLNMYNNEFARETYSRYLARTYPELEGLPVKAVLWELAHQRIIPPAEAVKRQKLREDTVYIRSLNRFEIPPPSQSSAAKSHAIVAGARQS